MRIASAFVLIVLAAGISPGQEIAAVLAKIPAKARAKQNPLEGDADAPIAGKKLFDQHCAECHGESAQGSKRAPGLRGPLAGATPGEIFWILTNGVVRRGMPEWSRLPEPQRWQIVVYLQSLQATGALSPTAAPIHRGLARSTPASISK